jgi:hypothetical protein
LTQDFVDAVKRVSGLPKGQMPDWKPTTIEAGLLEMATEEPAKFAALVGRVCFKPGELVEDEATPVSIVRIVAKDPNAAERLAESERADEEIRKWHTEEHRRRNPPPAPKVQATVEAEDWIYTAYPWLRRGGGIRYPRHKWA